MQLKQREDRLRYRPQFLQRNETIPKVAVHAVTLFPPISRKEIAMAVLKRRILPSQPLPTHTLYNDADYTGGKKVNPLQHPVLPPKKITTKNALSEG